MRILLVAQETPAPPSLPGSPRVYHLLQSLRARGHSVALVCGAHDAARWAEFLRQGGGNARALYPVRAAPQLRFAGRVRNLVSPLPAFHMRYRAPAYFQIMRAEVARALAEFLPDVLHVDQLAMAQYIPDAWRGAWVLDPHDAISLTETRKLTLDSSRTPRRMLARALMRYQILKIKNYERANAQRADAYVVNAEPDRAYLETFLPRAKLRAIPNAVDTGHFHPAREMEPKPQLVFTGSFSYAFNVDAMLYFHAHILPRVRAQFPALRLVIVGAHPPPAVQRLAARDALTTVTGLVDDVRPFVWESAVFISPLRGGTGMKNKLLNAMAMAKAIVATPASAEGLGARDGEHLLVAQDDAAFAEHIARVLNDRALAQRLGDAGRAFVEQCYSVTKFGAQFEQLYGDVLRARRADE
jgi:glycosyltransferase involved in cell wall biosynthesis